MIYITFIDYITLYHRIKTYIIKNPKVIPCLPIRNISSLLFRENQVLFMQRKTFCDDSRTAKFCVKQLHQTRVSLFLICDWDAPSYWLWIFFSTSTSWPYKEGQFSTLLVRNFSCSLN